MSENSTSKQFSNRLINESSPYLLQHAYNPVNWYPWGEEALQKAKKENKIILISIGYSACHWCHVMEKESFENAEVAELMNEHFINIKIDREERPDLDHIYMDAVQAMTGSGGWPLNVFLIPTAKPFFGGTYFPPVKAYNRSSWTDILQTVKKAWTERKEEINEQAEKLTEHLQKANDFGQVFKLTNSENTEKPAGKEQIDLIFKNIMKSADTIWGGFGKAPKFPQTFTIQYLLQYYHFTENKEALQQACLSIDKMIQGGIYDHIAGGMARYSTDEEWLAPHFEKMLYDNALLLNILCDVFQITKDKDYEKTIRKTIGFVEKELLNPEGGFYAALDADSEGEEGKYYVWDKKEVDELLKEDAEFFCEFFNISENGNWEHKNILRILKKTEQFAEEKNIAIEIFETKINACLKILELKRNSSIKPLLDDKILLGWNALMITALCKSAAALNDDGYKNMAEKCFDFLWDKLKNKAEEPGFYHTYKNLIAKYPAFLDDYSYLIQSCISLQEITSNINYLHKAKQLTSYVIENFAEQSTGYFFFTNKKQADVILRKKEIYDGATPSGNSIMAENLFYLSVVFNNSEWYKLAEKTIVTLNTAIVNYPNSFANWASVKIKQFYGLNEIVITGTGYREISKELLKNYMPNRILQSGDKAAEDFFLLKDKNYRNYASIYLCKNYRCLAPVNTIEKLLLMLRNLDNN